MPWPTDPEWRRRSNRVYGPDWRRKRKAQLVRDGYRCQLQLPGCTFRATEVDHIYGAAADPDHQHLRSACTSCHRKRTAAEQGLGYRGRKRNADPPHRSRTVWASA